MSLMDTADGVFMAKAYGWAFSSPVRKIFYNLTVTTISVGVALGIGALEVAQVLIAKLDLHGGAWAWLAGVDLGKLGYAIVGLFTVTWLGALAIWRVRRVEERWGARLRPAEGAEPS
jgi:high-affinity nickel-transport protein